MKIGDIEILEASCNIDTVQDGRGAIFTWIPDEPIVEFNMVFFKPNKIRGNHLHPEFTEYFLIVEGSLVLVTEDGSNMHASRGVCFRIPPNTPHAFHAITDAICIACLTKPWDKCSKPIIHKEVLK